ncbi:MAG: DUF6259 domain-containing protein [Clostridia bacterium]|nr:DUF6259 domain-containing protein [Clostridia bacterium]
MLKIQNAARSFIFDPEMRAVTSLTLDGREYIHAPVPVFELALLNKAGDRVRLTAADAATVTETPDGAVFSDFPLDINVTFRVTGTFPLSFTLSVDNRTDRLIEWADCPRMVLPALRQNGGEGTLLFPYNEGMLIDDIDLKEHSASPYMDPVYPSFARYCVFPNMMCSQFDCWLGDGMGIYLGMHDPVRGIKQIDVRPYEGGILTVEKTFCGGDYGKGYSRAFPVVVDFFRGGWEAGAEIYRGWFEHNLPAGVTKTADAPADRLPAWYKDSPLVVTYCVRGIHDMDIMEPNALFPYDSVLPYIDEIAERTGCRIMTLLMHWEGTAPWAPPYVWPPYGGVEMFNGFRDALHKRGHLLGVYCSGFGYTRQSNLLPFNLIDEFEREGLVDAMTAGEDGKVTLCRTCTGQRSGYDICVANAKAKRVLDRAYAPLFAAGIDYAQILDQNHGGGQYLCYAKNHDHAPCPGDWMTTEMQALLSGWNRAAGTMLLGCESAASEAYIGNLRFSDNRFELNWAFGEPIPLYAYLYHEYLRNFQGNQCGCEFDSHVDTLRLRMAYSFTAGDALTLVLMPSGDLMCYWGTRDFESHPDKDKALCMIANLEKLMKSGADAFLIDGRMIPAAPYDCTAQDYPALWTGRLIRVPDVLSTAWEKDGRCVQVFVNHTDRPVEVVCGGETFTVPALDGMVRER